MMEPTAPVASFGVRMVVTWWRPSGGITELVGRTQAARDKAVQQVVVIGGSLTGLLTAAALAGEGREVTVVDRDVFPKDARPRPGVPQSSQAHVLLYRGLLAAEELLPGLRSDLLAAGAVPFNGGQLFWRSADGWLPTREGYEVVSLTRPLLEHVVRGRVRALPGVRLEQGHRVCGLERRDGQWEVLRSGGSALPADFVIDASGRNSRLPAWLTDIGVVVPEGSAVDARVGYATRVYTADPSLLEGCAGFVVAATPATLRGGLALRAENNQWLVVATGYGDHRPPRDNEGFQRFLAELPDPVLSNLVAHAEPLNEVQIHRQTASVRHRYENVRGWPDGLVAVGDALCAFDPVYGQGITVGAMQALALRRAVKFGLHPGKSARLQRRCASLVETAWSIAVSTDSSFPTADGEQTRMQALLGSWTDELGRLAIHGNQRANDYMSRVYNLMGSPLLLLHPALIAAAVQARVVGYGPGTIRPAVLDQLRVADPAIDRPGSH